ncbi:MobA/MobL family protein [Zooshikella ganghwensis]|nr:MobA/MobL family protein [Zooshikella ganghwensis]
MYQAQFVDRGMIADINIHHAKDENPHAHILLTTRDVTPEGFGKKNRDWNQKDVLESWREAWEQHANRALERAGHDERIDHRSLAAQGSDRLATIHLGPQATEIERKGQRTQLGDYNREIRKYNDNLLNLAETQVEIRSLQDEKRQRDAYEKQFQIPEKWQDRETLIIKNYEKLDHLRRQRASLVNTVKRLEKVENEPLKTREHFIKNDEDLKFYKEGFDNYLEKLRSTHHEIERQKSGSFWSRMKFALAEKGYDVGQSRDLIKQREFYRKQKDEFKTNGLKRFHALNNELSEVKRIDDLIANELHRQTQAHVDRLSHQKKIDDITAHYMRLAEHTDKVVTLENKEAERYNNDLKTQLKSLANEINELEKTTREPVFTLPRKSNTEALSALEAARHLDDFKWYEKNVFYPKYNEKLNEWKAFEKANPERAEKIKNGSMKTKFKLYEDLKIGQQNYLLRLKSEAKSPRNQQAIQEIQDRYVREGSLSPSQQRLQQLKSEYNQIAEQRLRGGWHDLSESQAKMRRGYAPKDAANTHIENNTTFAKVLEKERKQEQTNIRKTEHEPNHNRSRSRRSRSR